MKEDKVEIDLSKGLLVAGLSLELLTGCGNSPDESSNTKENSPALSKEDLELVTNISKLTKEQKNALKVMITSYHPTHSRVKTSSTLTNGEETVTNSTA